MAILPGTRIRDNGVFGTITDNPLTAGATAFNSVELADLSVVSGNHALVTLDPLREFGDPEIVMVTAHSASATVATIQRAMFGTTAREHPQGTLWVHAACDNDFIEILTSGTRPADQYEGQFIYETDTNKLVGFGGVDWAPRDAGGTIGYASSISTQAGVGAEVDVTGCSIAVTVGTGRRIKITGRVGTSTASVADVGVFVLIKEGATEVGRGAITVSSTAREHTTLAVCSLTPSAGAHTYKLTLQAVGGTIATASLASSPNFILVEDIGAA